jgi:hypothetical protein
MLLAMEAATGTIVDSLKIGRGALIQADSMLYYYNWRGQMHLLSYNEGDMEVVSAFRISKGTKEHFAHPVIYQGVLYQRHGTVLLGYDIRE